MKDRLIVASAILKSSLLLSALIIASNLASLGARVEQAGLLAHSDAPFSFPDHLALNTGSDRLQVVIGNNTSLKVKQVK